MKRSIEYLGIFVTLIFLLTGTASCRQGGHKGSSDDRVITVFHAGSLSVPLKLVAEAFEQANPGVEVRLEAAGSLACIRKVTELHQRCDVMALADYELIDKLMIPEFATWNIRFAANELCLAYTPQSAQADRIGPDNWFRILLDPAIRYGRSDPDSDPCGYRTVIALKLNALIRRDGSEWEKLLAKDRRYIRGKEVDLNALLESRTIDYMFNYRSVAVQHGYRYLRLPDSINLSQPGLDDWYAHAQVEVRGFGPGSTITQVGSSIIYGITIPSGAQNPGLSDAFVRFLLGGKGREILARSGQTPLDPEFSPKSQARNSLF